MLNKTKTSSLFVLQRILSVRKYYVFAAVAGLAIGVCMVIFWPQHLTFSYQNPNCIKMLHVAPGSLNVDTNKFTVESASTINVGSVEGAAREACFNPMEPPQPGVYHLSVAFPGLSFLRKSVTIHVPSRPTASAVQLKGPIPLSKKLIIALSANDTVFSYHLAIGGKTVQCQPQQLGVGCDIDKLKLNQGSQYTLQLNRHFKGKKEGTVLKTEISTLPAVTLQSSTIKQGETVYATPKSVTLQFNKSIGTVQARLVQVDGEKQQQPIELQQKVNDNEVMLTWHENLERQKSYKIDFTSVQAIDGSSLDNPLIIDFKTSGGPKVTNISIGSYKVAVGAVATITFDQPLMEKQDLAAIITASNGAKLIGQQGSTVTIGFANVPRCTDVMIKVSDELKSNYDIKGGSAWQFTTRTVCQAVATIGTSAKGRPINAYIFGTGAKKVVYTGAIHGDERSTQLLMLKWIDSLEANIRSVPADKTIIVIPILNPDGYASGTRTNSRNVDLNRNFSTSDWRSDITTVHNKPFPGGGGAAPLSEPESAAIATYIATIRPTLVLSYHSIGGLVVANQAGNSVQLAKKYASLSGYGNATGSSTTFEYTVSGTADDYYGQVLGVPSILIELGSHTNDQFSKNQSAMWQMIRQ